MKKIAKDRKVIPDPIDDRKFQEWKESGKSGILLGITLNPKKCIGEKVRRIPINVYKGVKEIFQRIEKYTRKWVQEKRSV